MNYSGFRFGPSMTGTVRALIIVNVGVFVLIHIFPQFEWLWRFSLVSKLVSSRLMLWQFVTYMFLHVGLWHLVVNMLMLWFFGPAIEEYWGRRQFIFYYFFTGIGAGLCSFLVSFNSSIPVIGASGAIFGILVAYAIMFPETVILLFFIFPMKIRHAVLVLAAINLLGAISSSSGGIAYFAHLGGGFFGYLYFKNEWIRLRLSAFSFSNLKSYRKRKQNENKKAREEDIDKEVDRILDKISKQGLDSLSSREQKLLKRKSSSDKSGR
ncbi:MAG: rhomboid family intramembrane serine protease [Candidatus Omnitrophica bacterium]|nr:rhomboid family intramembrane serine protease [Candidatus Omnitrophota bacterium]